MNKLITAGVVALFVVVPILIISSVGNGWHRETSRGEHVGYVTATETSGIWWKGKGAYIKTDTQSSQEDFYCVFDQGLFDKLADASGKKAHVEIKFSDYLINGWKHCPGLSGAVITDVNVVATQ